MLFSIIITCYNQESFIRDADQSALSQHCSQREIIVVDDASADESPQILEQYGDSITLLKLNSNCGVSGARNAGAYIAQGDYLVFLDGDDLLLPFALTVYQRIVERKKPNIILGRLFFFSETTSSLIENQTLQDIIIVDYENIFDKDRMVRASGSAIIIHRDRFYETKGWTDATIPIEDLDMLIRLGRSGRTILICSPATIAYRVHANNVVHQIRKMIGGLHKVLRLERLGEYPGGISGRFARYAFIGGPVFFWVKKALRTGFYSDALALLGDGWLMIVFATAARLRARINGRRRFEKLAS